MKLIDRIVKLANTEIKLFSRKQKPLPFQPVITPEVERANLESFLKETYKADTESVNYGLYLYDQDLIQRKQKETGDALDKASREGQAGIQNRYSTQITETADYGVYGYSTRDEIRQYHTDAEIERWGKDPKVRASFQVLAAQVFADKIIPVQKGDTPESEELKAYAQTLLDEQKGTLRKTLKEALIVALSYQNAFFEKVPKWSEHPDFKGKRVISEYASKRPGLLEFITDDCDNVLSVHSLVNHNEYYHPDRFLIVSFNNQFSNPYGETLFASTYKFWKAKSIVFQDMAVYSNRYSQPIPAVTYEDPNHASIAQTISDSLYSGANVALPKGVVAEFIKALETGTNPYIPILEYLDKQISLGICGIDLSQGSYAADKVIADERAFMVADIREDFEDFLYEQVIKPNCKDNFDNAKYPINIYPRFEFTSPKKPLTPEQMTAAVPMLIDNGIVNTERPADINKIRTYFDFDEYTPDEIDEIEEKKMVNVPDEQEETPEINPEDEQQFSYFEYEKAA